MKAKVTRPGRCAFWFGAAAAAATLNVMAAPPARAAPATPLSTAAPPPAMPPGNTAPASPIAPSGPSPTVPVPPETPPSPGTAPNPPGTPPTPPGTAPVRAWKRINATRGRAEPARNRTFSACRADTACRNTAAPGYGAHTTAAATAHGGTGHSLTKPGVGSSQAARCSIAPKFGSVAPIGAGQSRVEIHGDWTCCL